MQLKEEVYMKSGTFQKMFVYINQKYVLVKQRKNLNHNLWNDFFTDYFCFQGFLFLFTGYLRIPTKILYKKEKEMEFHRTT